jgi:hypothetical protein
MAADKAQPAPACAAPNGVAVGTAAKGSGVGVVVGVSAGGRRVDVGVTTGSVMKCLRKGGLVKITSRLNKLKIMKNVLPGIGSDTSSNVL